VLAGAESWKRATRLALANVIARRHSGIRASSFGLLAVLIFVATCGLLMSDRTLALDNSRNGLTFEISFPREIHDAPLDGRVFLLISRPGSGSAPRPVLVGPDLFSTMPGPVGEPRFEINDHADTSQMFAVDVNDLKPGIPAVLGNSVLGYPLDSLDQIAPGDYDVQGLLNIYETFHRADGHTVKLPMDQGEGQQWNVKPGNLYSAPQRVHIPQEGGTFRISLTKAIPPIEPPADTKYIKHIRLPSELLTAFWGRPMNLGAILLLPEGWEEHRDAHYPLIIHQWHFRKDFGTPLEFRTSPPSPNMKGYERTAAEYAYKFYQDWTGEGSRAP
jgi:hypothetical protein